jgi:hypothetical protein
MALETANFGADMIFASHPHVIQGVEMLTVEGTGRKVPVFYSLGNFISNQRAETLNNRYTEQEIIAEVRLEYIGAQRKSSPSKWQRSRSGSSGTVKTENMFIASYRWIIRCRKIPRFSNQDICPVRTGP